MAEVYRWIRGQIEHEDTQINQRLSWFLLSQSFLFTAFAITVANQRTVVASTARSTPLLILIPCVALAACTLIGASIVAGILAMRELRHRFVDLVGRQPATEVPPIHGRRRSVRVLGLVAPVSLPLLFMSVWGYLLIWAIR